MNQPQQQQQQQPSDPGFVTLFKGVRGENAPDQPNAHWWRCKLTRKDVEEKLDPDLGAYLRRFKWTLKYVSNDGDETKPILYLFADSVNVGAMWPKKLKPGETPASVKGKANGKFSYEDQGPPHAMQFLGMFPRTGSDGNSYKGVGIGLYKSKFNKGEVVIWSRTEDLNAAFASARTSLGYPPMTSGYVEAVNQVAENPQEPNPHVQVSDMPPDPQIRGRTKLPTPASALDDLSDVPF